MLRQAVCWLICVAAVGLTFARDKESAVAPKTPDVVGQWVGEWGPYNPAEGKPLDKGKCKSLECTVVQEGETWQATFIGECGRPYKYTIKMDGRQAAETVMFKGTTDLGKEDGGVYDWIGRATDKEFFGFYTSSHYAGVFRMERVK